MTQAQPVVEDSRLRDVDRQLDSIHDTIRSGSVDEGMADLFRTLRTWRAHPRAARAEGVRQVADRRVDPRAGRPCKAPLHGHGARHRGAGVVVANDDADAQGPAQGHYWRRSGALERGIRDGALHFRV